MLLCVLVKLVNLITVKFVVCKFGFTNFNICVNLMVLCVFVKLVNLITVKLVVNIVLVNFNELCTCNGVSCVNLSNCYKSNLYWNYKCWKLCVFICALFYFISKMSLYMFEIYLIGFKTRGILNAIPLFDFHNHYRIHD
jgi:hypothetical protein